MFDEIRTTSRISAIYTGIFCLRRLILVILLVNLHDRPFSLIYAFLLVFTLNFIYLVHARANTEPIINMLEYFNEVCLIAILHLMLFFVRSNQLDGIAVWDAGIGVIVMISLMFFVNFLYLIVTSIKGLIKEAKLTAIKRQNLRKMRLNRFKRKKTTKVRSLKEEKAT